VCIPVRNEAATLTRTLTALAHQVDLFHQQPFHHQRYEIIVLANNCTDTTAAIARCVAAQYRTLALVAGMAPEQQIFNHRSQSRRLGCC
jgi:cellulose synthase/poly-beta-1,6-N-acetylglucosamine synthase-like glycosyltransferase